MASSIPAGAGVSATILDFALKAIGENFLAGFFLAFSRPFSIGGIIEVVDKTGTVTALSFRTTRIRTFDGRNIYLPNATPIKNPLTNYTKEGLLRHDFVIGLDYDNDMVKAIETVLNEMSRISHIAIEEGLAPFVMVNDLGTSIINLKVHF